MAVFGVEVLEGDIETFMKQTNKRLNVPDFTKNPFNNGFVKRINNEYNQSYVISMEALLPRTYHLGWFLFVPAFIFKGVSWWLLPGLVILSFRFFWSKKFFFWLLKLSLRHAGIKAKIRLMKNEELILSLLKKNRINLKM